MNLRTYYQKIRETQAAIDSEDVWLVSLATPDGGRAGVLTQTRRELAAKLIVDGRARVAREEEIAAHIQRSAMAPQAPASVRKIQVTLGAGEQASPAAGKGRKA